MSESATARRPRADAQRNRERIIDAAIEAFREEGLDVGVAEIARRAGVGSGTLFRNFPTKDDLIDAIVELHVSSWMAMLNDALAAEDPAASFDAFFAEAVSFNFGDRGMLEAFKCGALNKPALLESKAAAMKLTEQLVQKAIAAKALRQDLTTDDVYALAAGVAESAKLLIAEGRPGATAAQQRYVEIAIAGMRP